MSRRPRLIARKTLIRLSLVLLLGTGMAALARYVKPSPKLILPEQFDADAELAKRAAPENGFHKLHAAMAVFAHPPEVLAERANYTANTLDNRGFDAHTPLIDIFGLFANAQDADVLVWLESNAETFRLMRAATQQPYLLPLEIPASFVQSRSDAIRHWLLPSLLAATTHRVLTLDPEAAEWVRDTLVLYRQYSTEAGRYYQERGMEMMLYRVLEDTARKAPSEEFLKALQDTLVAQGEPWPDPLPLLEQYWHSFDWNLMYVPKEEPNFGERMEKTIYLSDVGIWSAKIRDMMPVLLEAAHAPAAHAEALLRDTPQFPYVSGKSRRAQTEHRRLVPNLSLLVYVAELKVRYHGALLALALARHKLAHGALPTEFAQLAEVGIAEFPRDPFTGEAYHGLHLAHHWDLYSLYRNGTDDNRDDNLDLTLWQAAME